MTGDEYYNKPLNSAVKMYLQRRKAAGRGPATAEEIFDALVEGGYDSFQGSRADALPGLRISLGKSTHTFVKLRNGSYGLCDWYGEVKQRAPRAAANGKADPNKVQESVGEQPTDTAVDEAGGPEIAEATEST